MAGELSGPAGGNALLMFAAEYLAHGCVVEPETLAPALVSAARAIAGTSKIIVSERLAAVLTLEVASDASPSGIAFTFVVVGNQRIVEEIGSRSRQENNYLRGKNFPRPFRPWHPRYVVQMPPLYIQRHHISKRPAA